MSAVRDPLTGLTPRQERFAELLASGLSQSDAYRQSYNVGATTLPETTHNIASKLAQDSNVVARVAMLRAAAQTQVVADQVWSLRRLIDEAEANLEGARAARQYGSANGALELIGRVTGLLGDKGREPAPQITRVVVVLDRRQSSEGGRQLVTEAGYRVLPPQVADSEEANPLQPPQPSELT